MLQFFFEHLPYAFEIMTKIIFLFTDFDYISQGSPPPPSIALQLI
jgi:hypothetical protein